MDEDEEQPAQMTLHRVKGRLVDEDGFEYEDFIGGEL